MWISRADIPVINDATIPRIDAGTIGGDRRGRGADTRLLAVVEAARHHGVDLHASDYRAKAGEAAPSPASLAAWAKEQGLHAKADKLGWKSLFRLIGSAKPPPPVILLFKDGTAGLMVGADPAPQNRLGARSPAQLQRVRRRRR